MIASAMHSSKQGADHNLVISTARWTRSRSRSTPAPRRRSARSKFVTPPTLLRYWRFGLNIELAYLPPEFDPGQWSMELRPIAAFENDHTLIAINPNVSVP